MLIAHVLLGILSVAFSAGLFTSYANRSVRDVSAIFTIVTIVSGILLLFVGSSLIRVCAESFVLVAFNAAAQISYRSKEKVRGEYEVS